MEQTDSLKKRKKIERLELECDIRAEDTLKLCIEIDGLNEKIEALLKENKAMKEVVEAAGIYHQFKNENYYDKVKARMNGGFKMNREQAEADVDSISYKLLKELGSAIKAYEDKQ